MGVTIAQFVNSFLNLLTQIHTYIHTLDYMQTCLSVQKLPTLMWGEGIFGEGKFITLGFYLV